MQDTVSTKSELPFLSIAEAASLLAKKKVSPVELLQSVLERIEKVNPHLNAFITVMAENARMQALQAEREIVKGRYRGRMHGIPIALKDNIWTAGVRTTAGSKILADFIPVEDATVVSRLRKAGAVVVGKTNLSEFAYGATNNNVHFGPVRNVWDIEKISGGSSGGSATVVAASMSFAALGSDTGGSIRIPASLSGIVGLKPTYGRVSCFGLVPLARSFDHIGPLTRTAKDAAIVLHAIAGFDKRDEATLPNPVPDYSAGLRKRNRLRLGWPKEFFFEVLDTEVRSTVEAAIVHFEEMGHQIEEVSLPHAATVEDAGSLLVLVEAANFHETAGYFPSHIGDYGEDVRARLEEGAKILATDYLQALEVRKLIISDFRCAFSRVDAILAPATPIIATTIGDPVVWVENKSEPVRTTLIRLNRPSSLAGIPVICLPCGLSSNRLPVGLQIMAPPFREGLLLSLADSYQEITDWHLRRPPDLATDVRPVASVHGSA